MNRKFELHAESTEDLGEDYYAELPTQEEAETLALELEDLGYINIKITPL